MAQRYAKLLSRTCGNNRNLRYFSPGGKNFADKRPPFWGPETDPKTGAKSSGHKQIKLRLNEWPPFWGPFPDPKTGAVFVGKILVAGHRAKNSKSFDCFCTYATEVLHTAGPLGSHGFASAPGTCSPHPANGQSLPLCKGFFWCQGQNLPSCQGFFYAKVTACLYVKAAVMHVCQGFPPFCQGFLAQLVTSFSALQLAEPHFQDILVDALNHPLLMDCPLLCHFSQEPILALGISLCSDVCPFWLLYICHLHLVPFLTNRLHIPIPFCQGILFCWFQISIACFLPFCQGWVVMCCWLLHHTHGFWFRCPEDVRNVILLQIL